MEKDNANLVNSEDALKNLSSLTSCIENSCSNPNVLELIYTDFCNIKQLIHKRVLDLSKEVLAALKKWESQKKKHFTILR